MGGDRNCATAAGKARILKARSLFSDFASRTADPERARRIEAELNDAWLRLQFAIVTGNPGLELAERRICSALLDEVRRGAAGIASKAA